MSPLLLAGIALAGGLGAATRYVLDLRLRALLGERMPWGILLVNASGSLALGVLVGLAAAAALPSPWLLIAGVGFLGGYTTFSTTSVDSVRLLREGRRLAALGNGLGGLAACVLAAGLGYALGFLAG